MVPTDTPEAQLAALRLQLSELAEPDYAAFHSKLVPGNSRPILGVRVPVLRKIARDLAKRPDWRYLFAALLAPESYEEQILCGLLLGYACRDYDEFETLVAQFQPVADNWAVCDICCNTFTIVARHSERAWPFLTAYLQSRDEMAQRFGIVMLMSHYRSPEDLPRVLEAYTMTTPRGYYAEMGMAWALSVLILYIPQLVVDMLRIDCWSLKVRRMTCQKILESRRISDDWRTVVTNLRRRIR